MQQLAFQLENTDTRLTATPQILVADGRKLVLPFNQRRQRPPLPPLGYNNTRKLAPLFDFAISVSPLRKSRASHFLRALSPRLSNAKRQAAHTLAIVAGQVTQAAERWGGVGRD